MNVNKQNKASGFTIIEVVLVLAIAGLIFLIVFLAVPALQRSQRDTQRRNDFTRFMAQVQQFQTNNSGRVPTQAQVADGSTNGFVNRYLRTAGDAWGDPLNNTYTYITGTPTNPGQYQYRTGQKCDGENFVAGGARNAAVRVKLEGGGIYCTSI